MNYQPPFGSLGMANQTGWCIDGNGGAQKAATRGPQRHGKWYYDMSHELLPVVVTSETSGDYRAGLFLFLFLLVKLQLSEVHVAQERQLI
jgi:hypothetical protein